MKRRTFLALLLAPTLVVVAALAVTGPLAAQGGGYTCDDVWDIFDQIYWLNVTPKGESMCTFHHDGVGPNYGAEGSHLTWDVCFRLGHVLQLANDLASNMGCV